MAPKAFPRGAVVLADLDPVTGSEQGRKRPCVVLSSLPNVRASGARPLYFVVPLTTAGKLRGPLAPQLRAREGALPSDSTALVMHARSIDPARILRHWGTLGEAEVKTLQGAVRQLVEG